MSVIERLHYMRKKEFEMAFRNIDLNQYSLILEIGCGDGFQSSLWGRHSNHLVSIDLTTERTFNLDIVCDAEYLPFKKGVFDIVYSSNVLEHIHDRAKALSECKRILSDDGIVVIMVPTSVWKALSFLVYYPILGYSVIKFIKKRLILGPNIKVNDNLKVYTKTGTSRNYFKFLFPRIHGDYQSHIEEFNAFRVSSWKKLLIANGLKIVKTKKTLLYSPPEFPIVPTIDLSKFAICSTVAFILKPHTGDD